MSLTHELISEKVKSKFGEGVISVEEPYGFLSITVKKEILAELMKFLRDDPQLNFHFLTTACGLHFPDSKEPFGMMYQLHNMHENQRLRIKCFTADPAPVYPSMTTLWPAANWMERETYDFFGFRFEGHPDLRRILNMDSLEGWPMRKEFPLEDPFRRDKDDKMFGR
jgi:NADH-quinone oxidoreductase subunit C